MKVTNVEKKEKSVVELTIQVEADAFEAAVQAVYLKERKNINVPGFRKGKATRKMIESMYGTGVFYEAAIEAVYPEALEAAVAEQGLDSVGYPTLEIVEVGTEQGLIFKAGVPVRPEVKLGQYKGLSASKASVEVTEEEIDGEMKQYVNRATSKVSVEREARNGDIANIDFEGFQDGVPFEGGKGVDYDLELGSNSFVPGFEEQIVGMNIGEEKDLDITFPENYVPDLAGKAVVFKVKLNSLQEKVLPTIDDEFAKDVSEFETLAEFRADLAKKIGESKENAINNKFNADIIDALTAGMECEIPEAMIDFEAENMMYEMESNLRNNGLTLDGYLNMVGMSKEQMLASAKPEAEKRVKQRLALEAVMAAEGIEVSEEEINAEFERLAEAYKLDVEKVKQYIPAEDLTKDLGLNKASKLVIESAVVAE